MKNIKKNIRHFFLLSGLAAGCMYGFNKLIETTSCIKKRLTVQDVYYFEWRYGKIFYTKQGTGSPILLIHDLHPASSSIEWNQILKKLAKYHTVYAIDLLGCGRSDKPNLTYTNYMYVQLITDFVKKIIQQKSDLIATGTSCSFSLMAAHMDDTIFGKLFFISPPSLELLQKNPARQTNWLKKLLELPVIGTFLYNLQMSEDNIRKTFEKEFYFRKSLISGNLEDSYYEAAHLDHSGGRFLYGSMIGNYTNINIIPALKKIEHPIFIIGSRESDASIRILDSYVKYDEIIETAYVSNCKKLPQLEVPDKLLEIIRMFYED